MTAVFARFILRAEPPKGAPSRGLSNGQSISSLSLPPLSLSGGYRKVQKRTVAQLIELLSTIEVHEILSLLGPFFLELDGKCFSHRSSQIKSTLVFMTRRVPITYRMARKYFGDAFVLLFGKTMIRLWPTLLSHLREPIPVVVAIAL
ncbi:hypothetical protein EW146_g7294 [Bondarzewia mesenterica]|uniref:Uncharacterized protein n=1 Tax=Bondarzewia mesenterica TaxID=1095465 RepID=A0A4S4LRU3_9AGAM|nr:hypothetical protein EW146_g7294 [Bondarzewia mesenterica]